MAKRVYLVDPKQGASYYAGQVLESGDTKYEVLDISRDGTYGEKNQYGVNNHMQAMAVAPIKDGVVDWSQVMIAYAGTNPEDKVDLLTDALDVADIDGTISKELFNFSLVEPPVSQFDTALGYADYIQKKYPQAKLSVTGHSLGGSLALSVGAKKQLETVTFNAPVPKEGLDEADRQYILNNPTKIASYLNADDLIGNYNNSYSLTGGTLKGSFQHYYKNGTGLGDIDLKKTLLVIWKNKVILKNGQVRSLSVDELWKLLNANHDVSAWFDEKGNFKYAQGKLTLPKVQADFETKVAATDTTLIANLDKLKKSYAAMSGTQSGRIKLDVALAYFIKETLKAHGQAGIEVIEKTEKQVESCLKDNWQETLQAARKIGTELSEDEIMSALQEANADENNLYIKPKEKLVEYIHPLEKIKADLTRYDQALEKSIQKRSADDQALAREFGL